MKSELSSLDLYYLVEEFQVLVGAKLNKVYLKGYDFLFDFYKTGPGRILFRAVVPRFAYMTKYKPDFPKTPPGFCMFLRKRLTNAFVEKVEQKGFERILEITFNAKGDSCKLIFELFSKGNVVLCDESGKIISPFKPQSWQSRTIKGGMEYEYPPEQLDPKNISFEDFKKVFEDSDLDSAVKVLAVKFSLGGVYAEEVCSRAGVDKDSMDVTKGLHEAFLGIFKGKSSFASDEEVFPFEMKTRKGEKQASFNDALDELVSEKIHEAKQEELEDFKSEAVRKVEKIIEQQEETIKRMGEQADVNQRKGELLFEKYQEVSDLLEGIKKDSKNMSWDEVKEKYQDSNILKDVNEKDGRLIIELE